MTDRSAVAVTVVAGSPRSGSFSGRLARHVELLLAAEAGAEAGTLDLGRDAPPLWSEEVTRREGDAWNRWQPISDDLARADGFVFVVPEWGGMAPPALKNLFLLCDGSSELVDKPALLVGVSSGSGGASPLAELRMSSYKNARICYIPEQVVVRDVEALLEGDRFVETPEAKRLEAQLVHALRLLVAYADALRAVRRTGVRDLARFPWNMS